MENLFTLHNLITLFLLILLQAVLGFDNLLYISLESKNAPESKQSYVRKIGVGLAIILRILLLLALTTLIEYFQKPIFNIHIKDVIHSNVNIHSLIVLVGGVFIIYTATKEIIHMMTLEQDSLQEKKPRSVASVIISIVLMNLIFSFDSILSAIALSDNFWIMAIAIVISGVLMIWLSDSVSSFLKKNRMYEVLGLFILFVVGIMLLSEGGHLAHLELFGNEVTPMSKTTFYFVIAIMLLTDIVQSRYQRKITNSK